VTPWRAGVLTRGEGPEDGLGLRMAWAVQVPVLPLAFLQRGAVVARVTQGGVGAVGQQPPHAGRTAVAGRDMQRQSPPLGIGLVDRGPGLDELVDR
jgi:hypothetical protein